MQQKVVSQPEWLTARKALLLKEKEFTKARDELSRLRRELPWTKVEKGYVFEGANGKKTFAELFDGRSQLIVYHFMFGPDWKAGCPHYARGIDLLSADYNYLDLVPKGRDENGRGPFWVRRHDEYDT